MWVHSSKDGEDEYSFMAYIPNFLSEKELNECNEWLMNKYNCDYFIGAEHKQNRKQLWYQDNNNYFCSSWKNKYPRWEAQPKENYIQHLQDIISVKLRHKLEEHVSLERIKKMCGDKIDTNFNFNSTLVNCYEDKNKFIAPHRDNLNSFGLYPTIVGLSIGTTRTMRISKIAYNKDNLYSLKLETRETHKGLTMSIPLENNSVFVFLGSTNLYHVHEILPGKDDGIRFSLTVRTWKG